MMAQDGLLPGMRSDCIPDSGGVPPGPSFPLT